MSAPWRLCFVDDGCWAYFATVPPGDVWGDDWNDAPHDCNAGTPYSDRVEGGILKVAFDGDLWTVGGTLHGGYVYDRWGSLSAEQINRGAAPWLVRMTYSLNRTGHDVEVRAGATLDEFKALVKLAGGRVYEAPRD